MTFAYARQKVVSAAPMSSAGIRLQNVNFGKSEWLRFDFEVNEGTVANPDWKGGYHWSIRNNQAWWGCSVD